MLPLLAVRSSEDLSFLQWNVAQQVDCQKQKLTDGQCRIVKLSKNGKRIAWCDGSKVVIFDLNSRNVLLSLDVGRAYAMKFSPNENLFCVWEPYTVTKQHPNGIQNLQVWSIPLKKRLHVTVQKNMNGWEYKWLNRTNVCAKLVGSSVYFFNDDNFAEPIEKLHIEKLDSFEFSPNEQPPFHLSCFIRGSKGAPSSVRVFQYPKLKPDDVIANKSFFKADSVKMMWNPKGNALLVKATVDVDTTGESYYGEQSLHFISCSGETSIVQLSKKGPIYDAAWAPNSTQFCVVFGFMPAKACIFNLKCNQLFEFGATPKNECYFNPQGNLLALAGFGNLRGNIEIWDFERKTQISQYTSPDTTYFEWCANGTHFITATTSPRLRVGNGYKLWHYAGGVCYEQQSAGDLYEVKWQPVPDETFPPPVITVTNKKIKDTLKDSKPAAYVPPHARGNPNYNATICKQDDGSLVTEPEQLSKSAQKNKKKREMKKSKQMMDQSNMSSEQKDAIQMAKYLLNDSAQSQSIASDLNETEKKIKALKKKLQAIEKLKMQQNQGKQLEKNQIEKLNTEYALLEELKKLEL
ncbi:eukaryotic translation initiation factor 2A-like [Clavelina lepadiformis]|uniref:Eukaryotic translation initiation factor 2A n=1 Tax=Clavelina lepadiformis TaxID=159417 RepID=A0ABP0F8K6_CLALP